MRRSLVGALAAASLSLFVLGCGGGGTEGELKKAGVSVKEILDGASGNKYKSVTFSPENFKPELIAKVKGVGNLRFLGFSGSAFGDDHVPQLEGLELVKLDLGNTKITDAGVQKLAAMPMAGKLATLSLNGTAITDAGAAQLEKLSNLKMIHLHGSKVTPEGFAKLKKALPSATIQEE